MSGGADTAPDSFDVREQLARIDRALAETGKLNEEQAKLRAEARKYDEEQAKLRAEARKYDEEQSKLRAESRKLERDRMLAPWAILATGMTAGAALVVAGLTFMRFILGWGPMP